MFFDNRVTEGNEAACIGAKREATEFYCQCQGLTKPMKTNEIGQKGSILHPCGEENAI